MRWLIRVTAWERVSLWGRFLCAFARVAALVVVLAVLAKLLGPPITIFLVARSIERKTPAANVTPRPLTDYSVASTPGTAISYFGYSFEVPWAGNYKTKEGPKNSPESGIAELKFDSGRDLLVIAPADQSALLSELVHDKSSQMGNLQPLFADLINRPPYEQYSALLNASPSTIRPFGPSAQAVRRMILLTIKVIALPGDPETGLFSFQWPSKRGFQIGDPQKTRRIVLEVLDVNGHYLEIICAAPKDAPKFTQPELNRILTTLRTVHANSFATRATSTKAVSN